MDITYIPMARGFVYLVAVLDWYSRKVLFWKVSITMDVHGVPEIVNTDQGSQFTSQACLKNTASASAWMAKVLGVTMYLSNDCGDP